MPKALQIASSLSEIVGLQACSHAQITLSGKGGNITVLKVDEIAAVKTPTLTPQLENFCQDRHSGTSSYQR
jgi:hypothetical protein